MKNAAAPLGTFVFPSATKKTLPKVLFLQGVFLKDCLEPVRSPAALASPASSPVPLLPAPDAGALPLLAPLSNDAKKAPDFQTFDPLEKIFRGRESWPTQNNLLCWNCSLPFDSVPIFIPEIIEPRDNSVVMNCQGNFCSFHCAVAHINVVYPDVNRNIEAKMKLKYLFKVVHGKEVREIPPMPPKILMKCYGGQLTQCQYTELRRSLHNQNLYS